MSAVRVARPGSQQKLPDGRVRVSQSRRGLGDAGPTLEPADDGTETGTISARSSATARYVTLSVLCLRCCLPVASWSISATTPDPTTRQTDLSHIVHSCERVYLYLGVWRIPGFNQLTHIDPEALKEWSQVGVLDVSDNRLGSLPDMPFLKMTALHTLDIHNNAINGTCHDCC